MEAASIAAAAALGPRLKAIISTYIERQIIDHLKLGSARKGRGQRRGQI